jgi:hypothetical protein
MDQLLQKENARIGILGQPDIIPFVQHHQGHHISIGSSSNPYIINPFDLSFSKKLPNEYKKQKLMAELGLWQNEPGTDINKIKYQIEKLYDRLPSDQKIDSDFKDTLRKLGCSQHLIENDDELNKLFQLEPGECKPDDSGMQRITFIVSLILLDSMPHDELMKANSWETFNKVDIERALRLLYEKNIFSGGGLMWPQLIDMYQVLKEMHDDIGVPIKNYDKLMHNILSNCVEPNSVFNKCTTMRHMPTRLLSINIDLESPRLRAIYHVLCNEYLKHFVSNSDGGAVSYIVRDEVQTFLNHAYISPYIESDYRNMRMRGISNINVSQNFSDFDLPANKHNIQNWIICGVKGSDLEDVIKYFKLSASEVDIITTRDNGKRLGINTSQNFIDGPKEPFVRFMSSNIGDNRVIETFRLTPFGHVKTK